MIPFKLAQVFIVFSVIFPILSVIIRYLQHDLIIDSKNSFDSFMFNSDAIFYSLVSKDIILNKGKLFDWIFAAAPEFFPTMLLTYIISLIIDNYFYSQIIFIVMQLLIFDYLMYKVTLIFTDKIFSLLSIVIINTLIIFFFNLEPFNYLFVASHHIGSFLGVLLTLFIYYSNEIRENYKTLIIYVLVFILTFSNPLFIGHLVIPLLTASIIIDILNSFNGHQHASHIGVNNNRICRASRVFCTTERTHRKAFFGIRQRSLIRYLCMYHPLHRGGYPCKVHKGKHAG